MRRSKLLRRYAGLSAFVLAVAACGGKAAGD